MTGISYFRHFFLSNSDVPSYLNVKAPFCLHTSKSTQSSNLCFHLLCFDCSCSLIRLIHFIVLLFIHNLSILAHSLWTWFTSPHIANRLLLTLILIACSKTYVCPWNTRCVTRCVTLCHTGRCTHILAERDICLICPLDARSRFPRAKQMSPCPTACLRSSKLIANA